MSIISPTPLIEALGDSVRDLGGVGEVPGLGTDLAVNGIGLMPSAPDMGQPKMDTGLSSLILGSHKPKPLTR